MCILLQSMGKKASLPFWLSFGMKVHKTSHTMHETQRYPISKLCAGILFEGFRLVLPPQHLTHQEVRPECWWSAL